jgi:hypothetical protein
VWAVISLPFASPTLRIGSLSLRTPPDAEGQPETAGGQAF